MRSETTPMPDRRQFLGVVGAAALWPAAGLRGSPISEPGGADAGIVSTGTDLIRRSGGAFQ
jgi:hypothetical protein